jgi:hypothetical protein
MNDINYFQGNIWNLWSQLTPMGIFFEIEVSRKIVGPEKGEVNFKFITTIKQSLTHLFTQFRNCILLLGL